VRSPLRFCGAGAQILCCRVLGRRFPGASSGAIIPIKDSWYWVRGGLVWDLTAAHGGLALTKSLHHRISIQRLPGCRGLTCHPAMAHLVQNHPLSARSERACGWLCPAWQPCRSLIDNPMAQHAGGRPPGYTAARALPTDCSYAATRAPGQPPPIRESMRAGT
jgi:hypothetical protein